MWMSCWRARGISASHETVRRHRDASTEAVSMATVVTMTGVSQVIYDAGLWTRRHTS